MYTVSPGSTVAAIIYLKASGVWPEAEVISSPCRWKVETLIATMEKKEKGGGGRNENGMRLNCSAETRGREGGMEGERKRVGKVRGGMKDRISAALSPFFSGGYLAADESYFMPMSSRYIPFSE